MRLIKTPSTQHVLHSKLLQSLVGWDISDVDLPAKAITIESPASHPSSGAFRI